MTEINKLADSISQSIDKIKEKYPRLNMAMMHHHNTSGQPMTFKDKAWLKDLYKDKAHEIVVVKASQVHITEHFLVDMFTLARKGLRGMYVLPSDNWRNLFVADRIDKLSDYSPYYKSAIGATEQEADTRQFKTIFGVGWKFVGSKQRNNFYEFPCSALLIDEYDRNNQDNLLFAFDRLVDEPNPYIRKYGNPTRSGFGIAKEFLKSDQKEWFVKCEHCKYEQQLDWWKNFVIQEENGQWCLRFVDGAAQCTQCNKAFNRLGMGRWITQNKSKISGYRVTRLFAFKKETDIIELFEKFNEGLSNATAMQNFCNNYLAIAYQDKGAKITEEDLDKCALDIKLYSPSSVGKTFETLRCIAGVDMGKNFHITISKIEDGKRIKVYLGMAHNWTELNGVLDAFNVDTVVIDALGGGYAEVRDFVRNRDGAWMCFYVAKDKIKTQYELKYEEHVVQANRTETLDLMISDYKNKRTLIPVDYQHECNGEFMKQMLMPVRVLDVSGRPIWTKGNDHFFHADGYEKLALQISGMQNSKIMRTNWRIGRS